MRRGLVQRPGCRIGIRPTLGFGLVFALLGCAVLFGMPRPSRLGDSVGPRFTLTGAALLMPATIAHWGINGVTGLLAAAVNRAQKVADRRPVLGSGKVVLTLDVPNRIRLAATSESGRPILPCLNSLQRFS